MELEKLENEEQKGAATSAVATLMQWLGVLLAGFGAIVLLLEKVQAASAITRFFEFSAIISTCAGLGFFLSVRRNDQKNARLLILLFLGCIPIFWSQLAAVVYAGVVGVSTYVPQIFQMPVATSGVLASSGFIALLLMVPLTFVAARILFPRCAFEYASVLSVFGVLLCAPVRVGYLTDAIIVLTVIAALVFEREFFSQEEKLQTLDSRLARLTLLCVPVIMTVRGSYYQTSYATGYATYVLFGLFIFWLDSIFSRSATVRTYVSDVCVGFGLAVLAKYGQGTLDADVFHLIAYGVPAMYFLAQSYQVKEGAPTWTKTALLVLMGGSFVYRSDASVVAQVAAISFPFIGLIAAHQMRSALLTIAAIFVSLLNFTWFIDLILRVMLEYRWCILMILGIGLVFGSSYVENGVKRIRRGWSNK